MIISASRRTDIPAFYFPWFSKRLQEGYLLVRNPINHHQVSKVELNPAVVDCIVFWTKNPAPILDSLELLSDYHYYFQFTLTPYDRKMERNLPPKKYLVETFRQLADRIGRKRVVWRYDPIIISDQYPKKYHLQQFSNLAEALGGYTERCVISWLDVYQKTERNMERISLTEVNLAEKRELAGKLREIAAKHAIQLQSCADSGLQAVGIKPGKCIDDNLITEISGAELIVDKDKSQRAACGCVSSIDIGAYNTCQHCCLYCYANYSEQRVAANRKKIDLNSPFLLGELEDGDKIYPRKMKSLKKPPSLFD